MPIARYFEHSSDTACAWQITGAPARRQFRQTVLAIALLAAVSGIVGLAMSPRRENGGNSAGNRIFAQAAVSTVAAGSPFGALPSEIWSEPPNAPPPPRPGPSSWSALLASK